ncbi:organomercurial lyase [Haloarcula nitratireducens]|uniref:Alkylmercury lyase family protein n=1 Tax=Haloarcula nitratireducens TaxID=2487749 RepID=A0AAW4PJK0_9EURY|nr:organomercurial lyase [Halomicroarcula nitratireducens]MBX0298159.1 alkylmercury lyase family protein [Halomicroarcula nitratireducens]
MCHPNSDTTTDDATDGCCDSTAQDTAADRGADYWLGEATLDQQLPAELQTALGRFVGVESVETLADWAEQIRQQVGGGAIDVEQLCHTDEDTVHWGVVDGERYSFQCFYDAVILAALEAEPVALHTVSPDGVAIEAHVVESEELSVTPDTAVFSLGIASDAGERSGGTPTLQDGYAAICPYVKAFPDREAYEAWAGDVPAATVAMPLSGATAFARALTREENDG